MRAAEASVKPFRYMAVLIHFADHIIAFGLLLRLFLALQLILLETCISLAYDALNLCKLPGLLLYTHLQQQALYLEWLYSCRASCCYDSSQVILVMSSSDQQIFGRVDVIVLNIPGGYFLILGVCRIREGGTQKL